MKGLTNKIMYLVIFIAALTSCKTEKYAPIISIDLKPHVIYSGEDKYELFYQETGVLTSIKKNGSDIGTSADISAIKQSGDIGVYIDPKTQLKYTMDDQGAFWTAIFINENYFYPPYIKDSYGGDKNKVEVSVEIDTKAGVYTEEGGMDFKAAGVFEFKYIATEDGETAQKSVFVRVYNEYKKHEGLYVSKLELINSGGAGVSLWSENYNYGKAKTVKFTADTKINRRLKINRFANSSSLKAYLTAAENTYPTEATIGSRKPNSSTSSVELAVKGEVVDGDKYIAEKVSLDPDLNPRDIETLIVISNRSKNNKTRCEILNIQPADSVPVYMFVTEYTVKRYEPSTSAGAYISSDGRKWREINRAGQYWRSTFREMFVKKTDFNAHMDAVNSWTDAHPLD